MNRKLRLFLLFAFVESKKRVKDIEFDSPVLSYENANTTFQNPILMDARNYGFVEFTSGGFYFKKRYLSMSVPDFQKELAAF
jgi:hypothetical protein